MSRRLGYQILNIERKKILKTEKLKKKLKTQEKNLKTQAKNSRIRHFFAPYMPKKWPKNKPDVHKTKYTWKNSLRMKLFLSVISFFENSKFEIKIEIKNSIFDFRPNS